MKPSCKISVIIVYKNNKNLRECIESALQQSFSNIEAVCVNNGSKDGAEKTAQMLKEKIDRIKLISLPQGLSDNDAKYAGLAAASGDFAVFIENNEQVSADFIKNLYLEAEKENKTELKNKFLYRRSFLENGRETAQLIKDAAAFNLDEQNKTIEKEFDRFEKMSAENIEGRVYGIMTRFNALEKEFYNKDYQIQNRLNELERALRAEIDERFRSLYNDVDKIYEYINSEINKKGSEINAVYDEITKNYKYTEALAEKNAAPIERIEKLEARAQELEKEIVVRYVNLKRITDLQFDEINSRMTRLK